MNNNLELAKHQLIGYAHAAKGYTIKSLALSMGLTKREWMKVRDEIDLPKLDKDDLDEYFKTLKDEK